MDYERMSIEKLEEKLSDLSAKRDALKAEQCEVLAVLERKQAEESIQSTLDNMSAAERAAWIAHVQAIAAEGVESQEQFGEI